jgi:hypothetical protein
MTCPKCADTGFFPTIHFKPADGVYGSLRIPCDCSASAIAQRNLADFTETMTPMDEPVTVWRGVRIPAAPASNSSDTE